jgi:hypothetical protein
MLKNQTQPPDVAFLDETSFYTESLKPHGYAFIYDRAAIYSNETSVRPSVYYVSTSVVDCCANYVTVYMYKWTVLQAAVLCTNTTEDG